jgi:predicted N-acetyltransferase YhbS
MTGSHHQFLLEPESFLQASRTRGDKEEGKEWAMVTIRNETSSDVGAREHLLDRAWGAERFAKTAERLREGREPSAGLSFIAEHDGDVVGTVRLWDICAGPGRPAVLLGPLTVAESHRSCGVGGALMRRAMTAARRRKHGAVLLVGDATYYWRFGFSAEKTAALWLPGPYERDRLLACELAPRTLDGARGMIGAIGRPIPVPSLPALIAELDRKLGQNLNHSAASARHAA